MYVRRSCLGEITTKVCMGGKRKKGKKGKKEKKEKRKKGKKGKKEKRKKGKRKKRKKKKENPDWIEPFSPGFRSLVRPRLVCGLTYEI